jgi:uncharacterized membrane protein affecting hemolysin expression
MFGFAPEHQSWVALALLVLVVVVLATIYSFWRRRFVDSGPRKGTAANPSQVKRDNPPDRR